MDVSAEKKNVFVTSNNQSGGITAHTVNLGPRPRHLDDGQRSYFLRTIPKGKTVGVEAEDNPEAFQYAKEIADFLNSSGYDAPRMVVGNSIPPQTGQRIDIRGDVYVIVIGSNTA
jgi:hypothetical protein